MSKFLDLELEIRNRLIVNTAKKMNMSEAIIEKDFWVCFMLDYLFTSFKYKEFICFKGGTSLSKVYNCIERFSEDIDLALDWTVLGLLKDEVYAKRSNRQQDIFNKEANIKTEEYIKAVWIPIIKEDLAKIIHDQFEIYIDQLEPQTICFQYPRMHQDSSILQILRLEIGALAEPVPSRMKKVQSYIADCYPTIFNGEEIIVRTMDAQRTFFEKVTILHREAMRINAKYPLRYARHFYDTYQMIQKGIGDQSLENLQLIKIVVDFKKKFYPCNWANYDDILQGKCKLVPNEEGIKNFSNDYDVMKNMIYGNYPTFDEIVYTLELFEKKLNQLVDKELRIRI